MLHGKQIVKRQVFTLGLCLRLSVETDEAGYFQFSKRQHLITTNSPSSTLTISCTFFCSLSLLASLSLPLPHSRNGSVSLSQILSLSRPLSLSPSLKFTFPPAPSLSPLPHTLTFYFLPLSFPLSRRCSLALKNISNFFIVLHRMRHFPFFRSV